MKIPALLACLFVVLALGATDAGALPAKSKGQRGMAKSSGAVRQAAKKQATGKMAVKSPYPRPFTVAIDAGHGGKDTGAIGPNGTLEKDVVLAIARRLEHLIRAEPGMRAVMVRRADTFIGLQRRAEIAQRARSDLFISLHADAYSSEDARGSSIFTLARRGALADFNIIQASDLAAKKVLRELGKKQHMHYAHVKKARFAVLKSPDVPSMLIETGFISNPEEETKLASQQHQSKVAHSIFNGILAYFHGAEQVRMAERPVVLASQQ